MEYKTLERLAALFIAGYITGYILMTILLKIFR